MTTPTASEISVKERPILFSGAMVRALLAGKKTQTRRAIKGVEIIERPDGNFNFNFESKAKSLFANNVHGYELADPFLGIGSLCPYGQPGDRLWVRESARYTGTSHYGTTETHKVMLRYNADNAGEWFLSTEAEYDYVLDKMHPPIASGRKGNPAIPSIHLKRKYSRLLLEITAVRVERAQVISEADAVAEGVESCIADLARFGARARGMKLYRDYERKENSLTAARGTGYSEAVLSYESLWKVINGPESWETNPWVWVVEFKVLTSK